MDLNLYWIFFRHSANFILHLYAFDYCHIFFFIERICSLNSWILNGFSSDFVPSLDLASCKVILKPSFTCIWTLVKYGKYARLVSSIRNRMLEFFKIKFYFECLTAGKVEGEWCFCEKKKKIKNNKPSFYEEDLANFWWKRANNLLKNMENLKWNKIKHLRIHGEPIDRILFYFQNRIHVRSSLSASYLFQHFKVCG